MQFIRQYLYGNLLLMLFYSSLKTGSLAVVLLFTVVTSANSCSFRKIQAPMGSIELLQTCY